MKVIELRIKGKVQGSVSDLSFGYWQNNMPFAVMLTTMDKAY